jgi:hypothetical protein
MYPAYSISGCGLAKIANLTQMRCCLSFDLEPLRALDIYLCEKSVLVANFINRNKLLA